MKKTVDDIELWKAKKQCSAELTNKNLVGERRVVVDEGEIVEFRYHYGIHFRTDDGLYLYLDEKEFYENFTPYGLIWEKIKWHNTASLSEILRLKLYDEYKGDK